MSAWRKICCPVDFSAASRVALVQAAELAVQLDAQLLLVHVIEAPSSGGVASPLSPPPRGGASRAAGDAEQLKGWVQDAEGLAPGRVTSLELSGDAAGEIVGAATDLGCDVIVMGTHGRTGLRRLAMGSVAENVIRTSRCPVVVVRPDRSG